MFDVYFNRNYYGKWIYSAYLFIYIAYLALLTTFIVNHDSLQHHDRGAIDNSTMKMLKGNNNGGYRVRRDFPTIVKNNMVFGIQQRGLAPLLVALGFQFK